MSSVIDPRNTPEVGQVPFPTKISELKGTVLFAGGGTGGHIFPGLAIAEQLAGFAPNVMTRFLVSTRPGDAEMLALEQASGSPISFAAIPAQPFGIAPRALLKFLGSWGIAVRAGREEIDRAGRSGPVVVAAMGGFVAAPVVRAAQRAGVPIVMVNLDAAPGRANRWISGRAAEVFTAADVGGRHSTWTRVPPIVRKAAQAPGTAEECRKLLGLDPHRPTLLVTGASLGARSINEFAGAFVETHGQWLAQEGWQIFHQTGKGEYEWLKDKYAQARIPARVSAFLSAMGQAWGAADCAVSRAGAGSVAEAWSNRVPTIFMPYPYHADQHQRLNAMPLVDGGGAMVVQDQIDAARNMQEAGNALLSLLKDQALREKMRGSLRKLGPTDGASRIAKALLARM